MNRRALWLICTALTIVAMPTVSHAQSAWDGSSSTDWFDADNWTPAGVPNAFNNATIDTTAPNATVISGGAAVSQNAGIGGTAATSGRVTVTGAGSVWNVTFVLGIGGSGTGELNILSGGAVNSGLLPGSIAASTGSTGTVTVDGRGSRWTHGGTLTVGENGNGTLNILNGGVVSSVTGSIGDSGTGRVTVSGAGSRWSNLGLFVGNFGTGTLTIQNGGVVDAGAVTITNNLAGTGTLNIGAALGAAPAAPGTLNAPTVVFGAGNGLIVFNHSGTSYTFAPLVSGPGTVLVEAGSTSLTANNTYSGNTTVNGGTLLVNGSIAQSLLTTVNPSGMLGGAGTVGDTLINGGTLAPGNSIGTLNVQGNLALTAASTYLVEVDPNGADLTSVSGTAALGGATVSAIYANGAYVTRRYTILSAQGNVIGTFNALVNTNLPANFTPSLSYDADSAYLDLTLNFTPPPTAPNFGSGLNGNQTNVATALVNSFNAVGGIPLAFGALTPAGLTQVSGEAATGTQQTTFDAMDRFLNVMTDPTGERGTGAPQSSAPSYADEANAYAAKPRGRNPAEQDAYAAVVRKAMPRAAFARRWSVWGAGFGGTQSTDGNATVGSNDHSSRIHGGAAGFDYRLTPDTRVGFALGGAGTKYDLAGGLGGGRSEMFQAGVYGRHNFGPAYIVGALAYGWQDITTDRIALLNSYRAEFDANAVSGRLEAGYRHAFGMSGLTPYAAGQFTTFFLPDHAEQTVAGTNLFALAYTERDVTASRSELGLRGDMSFAFADAVVTLRGRAAWAHNFDTDRSISAIFQTLPASGFVVNGASPARDAALVSAGAEARWLNGFSVAASFEGEFSHLTDSYAGKGVLRYQW